MGKSSANMISSEDSSGWSAMMLVHTPAGASTASRDSPSSSFDGTASVVSVDRRRLKLYLTDCKYLYGVDLGLRHFNSQPRLRGVIDRHVCTVLVSPSSRNG